MLATFVLLALFLQILQKRLHHDGVVLPRMLGCSCCGWHDNADVGKVYYTVSCYLLIPAVY